MYTCPICGFDRLEDRPANYTICPSCGTEFEYDDVRKTREELRQAWVDNGCAWWSKLTPAPLGWNGRRQLQNMLHPEAKFVLRHASEQEMRILLATMLAGAN